MPVSPVSITAAWLAYAADPGVPAQVVAETAANLIANKAATKTLVKEVKLVSVNLTGKNPDISPANAAWLVSLPVFSMAAAATLDVAGSASDIVTNLAALTKATKFTVTGANTIAVATAEQLITAKGITVATGSGNSLTVTGTAAQVLGASKPVQSLATAFTVSSATTAEATELAKLAKFGAGSTITSLTGAAADLLKAPTTLISKVTAVQLTGTSNTVTLADAIKLKALAGFNKAGSATLVVSDTAANLLTVSSSATYYSSVNTFTLSGASNVMSAADASTLLARALPNFAVASGAKLTVQDTAASIIGMASRAGVTSVVLTGVNAAVSASNAATIGALGLTLDKGATFEVSGTATALLAGTSGLAAALTKATMFTVTGASASQANTFAAMANFGAGSTMELKASSADLRDASNKTGVAKATTVLMTGAADITLANAKILAALPNFALDAGATLIIQGTATDILAADAAKAKATGFKATGATAAQAAAFKTFLGAAWTNTSTLEVADSAANLNTNIRNLDKATQIKVSGANAVSKTTADAISALPPTPTLAAGATFVVEDTAANIIATTAATKTLATNYHVMGPTTKDDAATIDAYTGWHAGSSFDLVADRVANLKIASIAPYEAKIKAFKLTGTNPGVTLADAFTLVGLRGFSVDSGNSTTMELASSALSALIAPDKIPVLATATKVTCSDTTGQRVADVNKLAGSVTGTLVYAGLKVSDTVSELLKLTTGSKTAVAAATSGTIKISTSVNVSQSDLDALTTLVPGVAKDTGCTDLVLADNITNANNASRASKALVDKYAISGSATEAEAAAIIALASTSTFAKISDSLANIVALDALAWKTQIADVEISGPVGDAGPNPTSTIADLTALVSLARQLGGPSHVTLAAGATLVLTCSQADLVGSASGDIEFFAALANTATGTAKISAIVLSDVMPTYSIGTAEYLAASNAIDKVTGTSKFTLTVADTAEAGRLDVVDANIRRVSTVTAAAAAAAVTLDLSKQLEGFTILASAKGDTVTGSGGADAITGGVKDDTFVGFVGADTVTGGDGSDKLTLTATSTNLNSASDAQLVGVEIVDATSSLGVNINLSKQTEGFFIDGSAGGDTLIGGAGNDTFVGFDGVDSIVGGAGANVLEMAATSIFLNAATNGQINGVQTVRAGSTSHALGVDTFATASTAVSINLSAQTEGFAIFGGTGNDTLTGGASANSFTGGSGVDVITGGKGNDTFNDFVGADVIDGGLGVNTLIIATGGSNAGLAAAGNNDIKNIQNITVSASTATTVDVSAQLEGFTINGGAGTSTIIAGGSAASGSAAATLTTITTQGGNDTITGGAGTDLIKAGDGNDTIKGFVGADSIDGGTGDNTLLLMSATTTSLNAATDLQIQNIKTVSVDASVTAVVNIDLSKRKEALVINGGVNNDTITGGAGADTITGGAGADMLTGAGGANTFVYTTLVDSLAATFDTVADFKSGDQFKIGRLIATSNLKTAAVAGTGNLFSDLTGTLTTSNFIASAATVVTLTGGADAGRYLVLNNATQAFSASDDAVIKLSGTAAVSASAFIM